MRAFSQRVVALFVGVALLVIAATMGVVVATISQQNERVSRIRVVVADLSDLREAVSDMAYAEAAYRRAPSDEAWQVLDGAMKAVPDVISRARAGVGRSDQIIFSNLGLLHQRYVNQIRATRDQPVVDGDDRVAGPALDAMQALMDALIDRYRAAVSDATEQQAAAIRRMWFLFPAAFAIAFALLGWASRLNSRQRRLLSEEAREADFRASHDVLTGLPNRAALVKAATRALAGSQTSPSALLLLDLDGFKPVNDTYGHPAGDLVLQEVAERLRACVRADDVPARLGGDEFAVLVASGSAEEGLIARIRESLERPFVVHGETIRIGVSIGAARPQPDRATFDALVREADAALYRDKRLRRSDAPPQTPAPGR